MISSRLRLFLGFIMPLMKKLGCTRYTYNQELQLFVPSSNRHSLKTILFLFSFLVLITFHYVQTVKFYLGRDYNHLITMFVFTAALTIAMEVVYIGILTDDAFFAAVNAAIVFINQYADKYIPASRRKYEFVMDVFSAGLYVTLMILWFLETIYFVSVPKAPMLFGYYFPENMLLICFPLTYAFYIYVAFCAYLLMYISLFPVLIYGIYLAPFFVTELRLGQESYRSLDILRAPDNLRLCYRSAQILQTIATNIIGKILIPSQTLALCVGIFGAFILIKWGSNLELLNYMILISWSVVTPLIWAVILTTAGLVNSSSLKLLGSWKSSCWSTTKERNIMTRFKRSCKPFTLNFGKAFVIRVQTVLSFLRGLTRGTVRALLTVH